MPSLNPFQFVLNASTNFSLYDLSEMTLVENIHLAPGVQVQLEVFWLLVHLSILEITGAFQNQ